MKQEKHIRVGGGRRRRKDEAREAHKSGRGEEEKEG